MRLSEAIKIYRNHLEVERSKITAKGYYTYLLQFCMFMRNPMIMQIAPEHVEEYLKARIDLGYSKNSLVVPSMALRKFFEYWKKKGYPVLNYETLPVMHKEGVEPKVASREVIKKILEQCAGDDIYQVRNKAIIMLFVDSGMRNGELCSLNTDIDTDTFNFVRQCPCGQEITFNSTLSRMLPDAQKCSKCDKTMEATPNDPNTTKQFSHVIKTEKRRSGIVHRRIFWYEETNTALRNWIEKRTMFVKFFNAKVPEALFIGVKSWRSGYRMTSYTVGLMLRDISAAAGVETVNAHSLRHMFGFESAEENLNNSNISDLMGHASLTSSFVYTHLRGEALGNAHRKVKKKLVT